MTKEVMQQTLEAGLESDNPYIRQLAANAVRKARVQQPPLPVQRKPLTDEEIKDCLDAADQMYCERDGDKELFMARAVEAKLKENK